MKLTLIAITLLGSVAFGADEHPCKKIHEACKAAGYHPHGHKETPPKGLKRDCLEPLFAGKAVEGVTVSAEEIAACKAKREHRRGPKKGGM